MKIREFQIFFSIYKDPYFLFSMFRYFKCLNIIYIFYRNVFLIKTLEFHFIKKIVIIIFDIFFTFSSRVFTRFLFFFVFLYIFDQSLESKLILELFHIATIPYCYVVLQ